MSRRQHRRKQRQRAAHQERRDNRQTRAIRDELTGPGQPPRPPKRVAWLARRRKRKLAKR